MRTQPITPEQAQAWANRKGEAVYLANGTPFMDADISIYGALPEGVEVFRPVDDSVRCISCGDPGPRLCGACEEVGEAVCAGCGDPHPIQRCPILHALLHAPLDTEQLMHTWRYNRFAAILLLRTLSRADLVAQAVLFAHYLNQQVRALTPFKTSPRSILWLWEQEMAQPPYVELAA